MDETNITYREILRQQNGWKSALKSLHNNREKQLHLLETFGSYNWVFVGCGTSYYLAQTASCLFTMLTGIQTKAVPGSEILMFPDAVFAKGVNYLMVPISRSGDTTETIEAAQIAQKKFNIPTLAVSCVPDSDLIQRSKYSITFPFEQEKSVVMTGSFSTMLLSILHMALLLPQNKNLYSKLVLLPDNSIKIVEENESLIKEISLNTRLTEFVYLGQGPFFGIANEAALKIQEMSISEATSFHTLEYRHGPKSTASKSSLITLLLSKSGEKYEKEVIKELENQGAKTLVIHGSSDVSISEVASYCITIKDDLGDIFNPILYTPIIQILAYYKAVAKNINPDSPQHLSAVVKL